MTTSIAGRLTLSVEEALDLPKFQTQLSPQETSYIPTCVQTHIQFALFYIHHAFKYEYVYNIPLFAEASLDVVSLPFVSSTLALQTRLLCVHTTDYYCVCHAKSDPTSVLLLRFFSALLCL
jgi:hypothetical protein